MSNKKTKDVEINNVTQKIILETNFVQKTSINNIAIELI